MKVKQIKKSIDKTAQLRDDIIATPYGSLVQSYLILNGIEWTDGEFVGKFKKAELPFLDDPDFMKKTLEEMDLQYIDIVNKPLAVCENENNTIFCPFVFDTAENEVVLLPLFKNHRMLHSQEIAQANGTWKIVDWRGYNENDD